MQIGLPGRNRTRDPLLRRQMLYPTELRAGNGSEGLPKMGVPPARRVPSTLGGKKKCGRGEEIRTPDILLPKQARYQTALHPEGLGL